MTRLGLLLIVLAAPIFAACEEGKGLYAPCQEIPDCRRPFICGTTFLGGKFCTTDCLDDAECELEIEVGYICSTEFLCFKECVDDGDCPKNAFCTCGPGDPTCQLGRGRCALGTPN